MIKILSDNMNFTVKTYNQCRKKKGYYFIWMKESIR